MANVRVLAGRARDDVGKGLMVPQRVGLISRALLVKIKRARRLGTGLRQKDDGGRLFDRTRVDLLLRLWSVCFERLVSHLAPACAGSFYNPPE
jgi:hypothetical protein